MTAIGELRSGDLTRIRRTLRELPHDPLVIGALIPLLARDELVRTVVSALVSFGPRAAGEMVSALVDANTPEAVVRRLPLALKSCASPIARDGLLAALASPGFEIRARCGRALLSLTDTVPALMMPFPSVLPLVEREFTSTGDPHLVREHVFNLLALAFDREPMRIAARSFFTDDAYVRGTALEYLETVLPLALFAKLHPILAISGLAQRPRRAAAAVREDLIRAGATITISLDELRRQLDQVTRDEA